MQMPQPDTAILSRKRDIVARLRAALPDAPVISDPAELIAYECDALTAYAGVRRWRWCCPVRPTRWPQFCASAMPKVCRSFRAGRAPR